MIHEYRSPRGVKITGTLERLTGVAQITGIDEKGQPQYEGKTNIAWDDQITVTRNGKAIFIDEDGAEWTFDQLTPSDDTDRPNATA